MELSAVPAAPHRRRSTLGRTCSLWSVVAYSPGSGLHLNQARPPPPPPGRSPCQFSKWEPRKINPESVAYFSSSKNDRQLTTFHHAIHHKLTTKTPRFATKFPQHPRKNKKSPRPPTKKIPVLRLAQGNSDG